MPDTFVIKDFRKRDTPDNNNNDVFYVDAEGPNGLVENAYYATKKHPPVVGESREWNFEEGEYGPRFRNPQQPQQGGGQKSSGGYADDKMRSKEQCMRGEAVQAAAYISANMEQLWENTAAIYAYIEGDEPTAPTQDLDAMKKQYQADLKEAGIPVTDGIAAIGAMYRRDKLEAGDDLGALLEKAKELSEEETPF